MGNRKSVVVVLCALMLVLATVLPASANAPMAAPWFTIKLANLPKGTAYVDMLIPLEETDSEYAATVEENLPEGFSQQASILSYCEDGFRSYTFHYQDAVSVIAPQSKTGFFSAYVLFFTDLSMSHVKYAHEEDVRERQYIRLAMLDAEGNILKVSQTFEVNSREFLADTLGSYSYNAAADTLQADTYRSAIGVILYLILSVAGIILTVLLEWLVALCFKLHRTHGTLVVVTNFITQVCMRVVYILLYSTVFYSYALAVVVLELGVYLSEWLIYRKFMPEVSGKKCLLYTIAATTISLVVGIGLLIV